MSEKKLPLFDDSSSDSEAELKINENYASRYNVWRNKEELQKYKDLKKNEGSESSSESESEAEDQISSDDEFLVALSLIKGKDPRIYDKNYKAFKEKEPKEKTKSMKEKPMYMKDYERSIVLERGGKLSDEDDEQIIAKEPTYGEEQASLVKSFKEAFEDFSDDEDDLLKVREKSKKEQDAEEADYKKWLKGEDVEISEDKKRDLSYLRSYWSDPNLDENEKFLRDFFLEKKYLMKDSEIPSYEDITNGILSDDERTEEREKFELKYNYRYQEPDEEYIKRYPRSFADSVRKVDNRRKQKREEKAERQKVEKLQKKEEIKRLKALKRKEIEEKFMKLKEVSGQEDINFNESDIEGDFDPDKHDKKMREMFNDDYYQVEEEQRPNFEYDEELDSEKWDTWTSENLNEHEKNINGTKNDEITESSEISDQNKVIIDPKEEFEKEMIDASCSKKKPRKKSLFAKMISQSKPIYDPDGKSFEEYLDEYYKLDCEDIIGGMPVRYKYRKVIPNDFGLTVDEILAADDRDLNRWCSVKKTCQYRNDDEEWYDVQAYRKKSQNLMAKKKKIPSLFVPKETDDNEIQSSEEINSSTISVNEDTVNERGGKMQCNTKEDMHKSKEDHNSSVQFNECKKKSKKKKKKGKVNNSDIDINVGKRTEESQIVEQCNMNLEQNASDNLNSTENEAIKKSVREEPLESASHKSRKRKGELSCNSPEAAYSEIVKSNSDISPKKYIRESQHNKISDSNNSLSTSMNCNFVSESTSLELPRKKKKKRQNKNDSLNNVASNHTASSKSKTSNQNKHFELASGDKRLGVSDERLAAYGINPKKFKGKIMYGKK